MINGRSLTSRAPASRGSNGFFLRPEMSDAQQLGRFNCSGPPQMCLSPVIAYRKWLYCRIEKKMGNCSSEGAPSPLFIQLRSECIGIHHISSAICWRREGCDAPRLICRDVSVRREDYDDEDDDEDDAWLFAITPSSTRTFGITQGRDKFLANHDRRSRLQHLLFPLNFCAGASSSSFWRKRRKAFALSPSSGRRKTTLKGGRLCAAVAHRQCVLLESLKG